MSRNGNGNCKDLKEVRVSTKEGISGINGLTLDISGHSVKPASIKKMKVKISTIRRNSRTKPLGEEQKKDI
jgi:hypothetical protein